MENMQGKLFWSLVFDAGINDLMVDQIYIYIKYPKKDEKYNVGDA